MSNPPAALQRHPAVTEVEGELEEPLPLLANTIEALTTLQRFEMSREDGSRSIRALDQLTREFKR